jgi:hypothetical protein
MESYTPSLAELEIRLAKLERQNRRLKRLGLLFLLIAGSGFLLAQAPRKPSAAAAPPATPAPSYDTLVVHRLELRDKAGMLRGLWTLDDLGPALELYDAAGKPGARLSVDAIGADLRLYSRAGEPRATLSAIGLGSALWLSGTAEFPRAALGDSSFDPLGKNDKVTAYLQVGPLGPSFQLQDAQQFKAVVGVTGLQTIATGESHTTSAAAVTLFGKDGKVIWRAP